MYHTKDTIKNIYHFFLSIIAAIRYGFPGRGLTIIGVTGTDGKSSTVTMVAHILRTSGFRTAHFSSVSHDDGSGVEENTMKMTTPGRGYLQEFLSRAKKNGCTHAVLEITSEGIRQHRHRYIPFHILVFTTLTPEHIERHGSFDDYAKTKISLLDFLQRDGVCLVHDGDENLLHMFQTRPHVSVGATEKHSQYHSVLIQNDWTHSVADITARGNVTRLSLSLGGPFVVQNALMAIAVSVELGIPSTQAVHALSLLRSIPGRCEVLSSSPLVVVDYAHTVSAVEQMLGYARKHTKGKIIHVFGAAGGGRDRWKRPLLAKFSQTHADISILTEENPFDEDPQTIFRDIRSGFSSEDSVFEESTREEAVKRGLSLLGPDDTLLLMAKGSETVIAGPRKSMRGYNERQFVSLCINP